MRDIRLRIYTFAFISVLSAIACALVVIFGAIPPQTLAYLLLAVLLLITGTSAVLWLRGCGRLKMIRLIAENPILHIRTAVVSDLLGKTTPPKDTENTEVIISYFGILLDTKIIKFNQDGIKLMTVEIGEDFISFTCGTDRRTQNIRLLHPAIDSAMMNEISERFRYETGITPTLLS